MIVVATSSVRHLYKVQICEQLFLSAPGEGISRATYEAVGALDE